MGTAWMGEEGESGPPAGERAAAAAVGVWRRVDRIVEMARYFIVIGFVRSPSFPIPIRIRRTNIGWLVVTDSDGDSCAFFVSELVPDVEKMFWNS